MELLGNWERTREIPGAKEHELYGDWIKTYSSEEFGQTAQWCIELLDKLAEGKSESEACFNWKKSF